MGAMRTREEDDGMITWIAGIGAALCVIYYIVITVYAGFSVSFSWFWLLAAGFLAFLAWGSRCMRLHPKEVPLWVSVPVITFVAASFVILCVAEACVFVGAATSEKPGLDYVIVLGTKIHERGISNSLRKRLDKAVRYSQESPGTVFILSGGQGADEPMPEAEAMYEYLVRRGLSPTRLLMEPDSTSTLENIAFSQLLIRRQEQVKREMARTGDRSVAPGPYLQVEEKPVQIGILTSNYHVFRAKMIAKKRGMEEIYGISAASDPVLFVHLCVRECAAILKDRLMGNM